ncbi:MAG: MBOAT family protein [Lachnospiraceae bacterium]|nr:MBOAT family protein [Lachnospiraceae bacterium]
MLFNTVQYLIFLPIVVLIYYILPKKVRYVWLLGASCYFYMQWNQIYILLLLFCTMVTYTGGLLIERFKVGHKESSGKKHDYKKLCLVVCIVLNLGLLFFYKYFSWGVSTINRILLIFHVSEITWERSILLPVGISFYILQSLGYLIDVYRGDIYAEKNFIRYALFVSFFPQLVAGPIERSKNLLVQLHEAHDFKYENVKKGAILILYGLFLKVVIADKAAIIVNTVYADSSGYPGFFILIATVLFSIQIYCDFYGYSTIARGSALLMGIRLMDNFNAPYYARSVREFWRRWHISLSGWFRDYLYIPLGGSRKGTARKECNRMVVFAVSGLWHGASLSFLFWGLLNGMGQVAEDLTEKIKKRLGNPHIQKAACFSRRLCQMLFTFGFVTFAWMFFRASGLKDALLILRDMCSCANWTILFDGSLYELGVAQEPMNMLLIAIVALLAVDYLKYKGHDVAELFLQQDWWFRTVVIMGMIFIILLYGCYGTLYDTAQFIYFQF